MSCWTAWGAVVHRRPPRRFTPAARLAMRACAIALIHRPPRRSWRSCAPPAPGTYGARLRGIIVVLWRAGLRIGEALALAETDLDPGRGALLIGRGKGGKRREVGMDGWGWGQLEPWLEYRRGLPVGPLLCVLHGPTRGRPWAPAAVCRELRRAGARAGVRRRLAPHQLRHAHAVEMAHKGGAAGRHPAPTRARPPRHHQRLPPRDRQH